MNKILVSLLIAIGAIGAIGAAEAGGPNGHYNGSNYNRGGNTYVNNNNYYRGGGGYNRGYWNNGAWVAPLVVGGFIGAAVVAAPYYAPPVVEVVPVPEPAPVYTNTVQTNNQCPYPDRPTYNRIYTTDRFGNNIQVDQFIGCR
jgi:hypothetical protein